MASEPLEGEPKKKPDRGSARNPIGRLLPINKGPGGDDQAEVRKLPQITGVAMIAALSLARDALGNVLGNLKPSRVPGRQERFRALLLRDLAASPVIGDNRSVDVRVDVNEAFGKPTLVSVDLLVMDPERRLEGFREKHLRNRQAGDLQHEEPLVGLVTDLLERAVAIVWDNPEMAPVAVRARVVAVHATTRAGQMIHSRRAIALQKDESLLLDMTDAGYVDEIGRVEDLYAKYGAPASDPHWHP